MSRRFSIFYGDGSVWRSEVDGSWDEAPHEDVQVVMVHVNERKGYREIVHGIDEYRLPKLGKTVKYGRQMDGRKYNALVNRAMREG